MRIIADLHLHSKYSRAVSQEMVLPQIATWAQKKGIGLVGTGDWTHPLWLREIKANLEEVAPGLYALKGESLRSGIKNFTPPRDSRGISPLFILATEISSIYSQGGRLRRIHSLILAPSIEIVEKINKALVGRGANLMSDGRPVTGIPAQELVKLILSVDENSLIIPAHIWTPWFSLYGSESGFDSIDECFGEQAKFIYAIETGLSSDPAMNWRIAELDKRNIVSFSDAHSGPKLGREATVFEISDELGVMSYETIRKALTPNPKPITHNQARIAFTIEFHPEEGKYHYTGHRDCGVRQSPEETKRLGEICPVCGKHLTIGV
ncbi:MAG: UvrD/REP helicase, partial [Microgenomates group bacterium LiPW_16]